MLLNPAWWGQGGGQASLCEIQASQVSTESLSQPELKSETPTQHLKNQTKPNKTTTATTKIQRASTKTTIEAACPSPWGPEVLGSKPHHLVPENTVSRWRRCKQIKRMTRAPWNLEIRKVDAEMTAEGRDSNESWNHNELCSEACGFGKQLTWTEEH